MRMSSVISEFANTCQTLKKILRSLLDRTEPHSWDSWGDTDAERRVFIIIVAFSRSGCKMYMYRNLLIKTILWEFKKIKAASCE